MILVKFTYYAGRELNYVPQAVIDHCFVAAATAAAIQAQEETARREREDDMES